MSGRQNISKAIANSKADKAQCALQSHAARSRLIAAVSFGNFLESFDFTVYSYFAPIIGLALLKTDNAAYSTYIATILFGLGFLARPLGSLWLGAYADKCGRKAAMLITIMLMGLGSAFIGCAPPYAVIGFGAPFLALIGRLLQGFAAGGDLGSSTSLLMESAQINRRGFYTAWQFITQGLSMTAGALCAFALYSMLSPAALQAWGWRVPFALALLIIPAGLYIRAHISETYRGEKKRTPLPQPMQAIWRHHRCAFLLAIITTMPITLTVYITVLYMPTYFSLIRINSGAAFLTGGGRFILTAAAGLLLCLAALSGGIMADRLAKRKNLALALIGLMFWSACIAYNFIGLSFIIFIIAMAILIIALGMLMTVQALLVLEAFPRPVRASGMGVALSLGAMIFGGSAQAIVTRLIILTDYNPLAPFFYLGPMLIIGFIAFTFFREERYP